MAVTPRAYVVEARKKSFELARKVMDDPSISLRDIADDHGVDRHGISYALLVLRHGTPEEIAAAEQGLVPLRETRDAIFKRVPAAELMTKRKPAALGRNIKNARELDSEVWQKLREGLLAINSLPIPKDTAAIVRRNPQRIELVNRQLLAAVTWIKEFEYEITK